MLLHEQVLNLPYPTWLKTMSRGNWWKWHQAIEAHSLWNLCHHWSQRQSHQFCTKIAKARKWTAFSHHPSFKALSLPVISCYVAIIIWSNSHIKPTDLQAFSTYCDQVRVFRFRKSNAKVIPMNLTLTRHTQCFPSSLRWWSIFNPLTSFSAIVTADLLANACHSQKSRESQKQGQYPY